jgi:hypothetical protein
LDKTKTDWVVVLQQNPHGGEEPAKPLVHKGFGARGDGA